VNFEKATAWVMVALLLFVFTAVILCKALWQSMGADFPASDAALACGPLGGGIACLIHAGRLK